MNKQSSFTCGFLIKNIVNNFQPVIGETIVSKVQGGAKQESKGAKHPLAPPQIRLCLTLTWFSPAFLLSPSTKFCAPNESPGRS